MKNNSSCLCVFFFWHVERNAQIMKNLIAMTTRAMLLFSFWSIANKEKSYSHTKGVKEIQFTSTPIRCKCVCVWTRKKIAQHPFPIDSIYVSDNKGKEKKNDSEGENHHNYLWAHVFCCWCNRLNCGRCAPKTIKQGDQINLKKGLTFDRVDFINSKNEDSCCKILSGCKCCRLAKKI